MRAWCLFACLFSTSLTIPAIADIPSSPGPIGFEQVERFDLLPYLWDGTQALSQSSWDRRDGNTDRSYYLYELGAEKVMVDVKGSGCLYRWWVTSPDLSKNLRIFVDDDVTPRFEGTIQSLFSGTQSPFLTPFTGYTSGGYNSYHPIVFNTRLRISTTAPDPSWYYSNFQMIKYTQPHGLQSTTSAAPPAEAAAVWTAPGNPNPTPVSQTYTGTIPGIPASQEVQALAVNGPAQVVELNIRIPAVIPNDAVSLTTLQNLRLRLEWDSLPTAAVNVPLSEFFIIGLGEVLVNSLPIKVDPAAGGWYKCYFPMPFGTNMRFALANTGTVASPAIEWEVKIADMPNAANLLATGKIGYFHAFYNQSFPTVLGQDHLMLQTIGKGVLVGSSMTLRSLNSSRGILEGDERIRIDASRSPQIYGTGTEDYLGGGWYFQTGPFNAPTHGHPAWDTSGGIDKTTGYRMHLTDKIPFYGSIHFGLEHAGSNEINGNYSSCAYYYLSINSTISFNDKLDVDHAASEAAHSYSFTGPAAVSSFFYRYPGDDDADFSDSGRTLTGGYSQFTMKINPANTGVKLRRRMSSLIEKQSATVNVDGQTVGEWYDAGGMTTARWLDSDFEIPAAYTAGKSQITIRLTTTNWTEYSYWIYSYTDANAAPAKPYSLTATALAGQVKLVWMNSADPDIATVMIRASTTSYPLTPADGTLVANLPAKIETAGSADHSGLIDNQIYYYSIFTGDTAGNWSTPLHATATPYPQTPTSIKTLPDSTNVALTNVSVTGIYTSDGCFYVQDDDRSGGIRITGSTTGLALGDKVYVNGVINTRFSGSVKSERHVQATTVTKMSAGPSVVPVFMIHRSIGGQETGLQPGVVGGVGLNNIGTLARVCGKVTAKISNTLYIDDGSGIVDPTGRSGILARYVSASIPVNIGDYVIVTGVITGSVPSGATANRRALWMRNAADLIKI